MEEFRGHPIHYLVETDDREIRKEAYRILLSALYDAGRIKNRRYTYIDIRVGDDFPVKALRRVYRASWGGTVVIRMLCSNDIDEDTEYAGQEMQVIGSLAEIININRHKVLTVICLPRVCEKIKAAFREAIDRLRIHPGRRSGCRMHWRSRLRWQESTSLWMRFRFCCETKGETKKTESGIDNHFRLR